MGFLTNTMVDAMDKLPEQIIWRFARRYIAGADLDSGIQTMIDLQEKGILTSMDILGEDTSTEAEAVKAYEDYLKLINAMKHTNRSGNISLKLTQLGLNVDKTSTSQRVVDIAKKSWDAGFFFRLDMEDATTTDYTLDLFRDLRKENSQVGAVIQAYLKRSYTDVKGLVREQPVNIRICKGIYKESAKISYHERQKIRDEYMSILRLILDHGSYPAIATHDPFLIRGALREIQRRGLDKNSYEFQMLHGVGFKLRKELLEDGHPLRIYIPFGAAWKAYSLRRFRENPTLAFYVVKNLVSP